MKVTGIIAEYNPFHNGHFYQIRKVKEELKSDYLVVVLSGDHVQRGTPALLDKHTRTRMALRCGADLVLELPVSFACSSAEYFARGAVSLLDGLGVVTHLCFGSETPDLGLFLKTASLLNQEPEKYRFFLKEALKKGASYPSARTEAILSYWESRGGLPGRDPCRLWNFLNAPNNILGVEYCKVLARLKSSILPVPILRTGAGYHDLTVSAEPEAFPSASAIRNLLVQNSQTEILKSQIPAAAYELFAEALSEHRAVFEDDYSLLLQYQLLKESVSSLSGYLDMTEDLSRRILHFRSQYRSFSQFCRLLKTKDMTYTRIQRCLLHVLLNLKELYPVSYARVLGFRRTASPLLHQIKGKGKLPLLTKLAGSSKTLSVSGQKLLEQEVLASNLYQAVSCQKSGLPFLHEYQKQVAVEP